MWTMTEMGVGSGLFLGGMFFGMWLAKHPEDARGYAAAALAKIKGIFSRKKDTDQE